MTPRALNKDKKGFTIIEVMIVLAIAGLIILIVFLAVPALQRNSRNTQRRNDAARVSGLVAEYVSNNNGSTPTSSGALGNLDLSYYDAVAYATSAPAAATGGSVDTLTYVRGVSCQDNGPATSGGSNRSYSVFFYVETSGQSQRQCV